MFKDLLNKANIKGTIALIIVVYGLYIVRDLNSPKEASMAVCGFIGIVLGYYFVNKDNTKQKE